MNDHNDNDSTSAAINLPWFRVSKIQLDTYYRYLINTCTGSITGAILLVFILRPHVSDGWLAVWFVVLLVFSVIRIGFASLYNRTINEPVNLSQWFYLAMVFTALSGLTWGAVAFQFTSDLPDSIQHSVLLLLCIVTIASIPTHGAIRIFYLLSSIGILGPIILRLIFDIGEESILYGALLTCFCLAANVVAGYYRRAVILSSTDNSDPTPEHAELIQKHATLGKQYLQKQQEGERASQVFSHMFQSAPKDQDGIRCLIKHIDDFSGDYIFKVEGPNGELTLIVADFTGHGMTAAMCAIPLLTSFTTMSRKGLALEEIVNELNHQLVERLTVEHFCCACIVQLNADRTECVVWNGGLPDAFLLDQDGGVRERLTSQNLPLGISRELDSMEFEKHIMNPGESLLVYTDGVIEAQNDLEQHFGLERLLALISKHQDHHEPLNAILQEIEAFTLGADQHDDIAMLYVKG